MTARSRLTRGSALAAASLLVLAACGDDGGGEDTEAGTDGGDGGDQRACVILPDADSSSRWENGDRPALEAAFEEEGFSTDIQNALNDTSRYATIADQQIAQGCTVMVLVDLNGAGVQVATKAKAQGIPVIAYDRPIAGADYYISFDNFNVGELQGQMILDALEADGTDPATASVVYVGGDPTDGNAKQFHDGADSVLSAAGIEPAFETPGTWDQTKVAPAFEQAYTALQGDIDAVWAANDTNASVVIQVLDKNNKTIPVSGQDATPVGLQNVLLGKQAATVYKPFQLEAASAVELAAQLAAGEEPTVEDEVDGVPFIPQTPIVVTAENMQQVFDDGNAQVADVCKGPAAQACADAGIS